MEFLHHLWDLAHKLLNLLLHFDRHVQELVTDYGPWTYLALMVIIFCETGLVVTPFLPGDSLLFTAGALAVSGGLRLEILILTLTLAAIAGDTVNYRIGAWLGPRLARGEKIRYIKPEHLERTHAFFERYGGKTIIIARFVPIVRTFAPFVAGVGSMTYGRFMSFNVIGAVGWVVVCTVAGYLFGNLPVVKDNFGLVALAIVGISLLPAIIEIWRERRKLRKAGAG